jgi:hypothetical protein
VNAGFVALTVLGLIVAAVLGYAGAFGTTGAQWYEACWEKSVRQRENWTKGKEPLSSDGHRALIWADCDVEAERGAYAMGMIFHRSFFVPDHTTHPEAFALALACPSDKRDVPIGGLYLLALDLVQKQRGPSFFDRFLPARFMIGRAMKRRWPSCSRERKLQGYPKIVEKAPGRFDFEKPCVPCARAGSARFGK